MEKIQLKIGGIIVEIEGENYLMSYLKKELQLLNVDKPRGESDLKINLISSRRYNNTLHGCEKTIKINEDAFLFPKLKLIVCDGNVYVVVDEDKSRYGGDGYGLKDAIMDIVWKIYDRTYMSRLETLTYVLINNVLEPLILYMFPDKVSLVHAAAFSYNGNGFLISGSGGVGKTTTSLEMIYNYDEVKYLSDDISIIDDNGNINVYPRKMMIYPYNFEFLKPLQKYIEGRNIGDKIHWNIHILKDKHRGARRRVSPFVLLPKNKIEHDPVPIKYIFFLTRDVNVKELVVEREDIDFFVKRIEDIMRYEEYHDFGNKFLSEKENNIWMSKYSNSLKKKLYENNTHIIKIRVPPIHVLKKKNIVISKIVWEYINQPSFI